MNSRHRHLIAGTLLGLLPWGCAAPRAVQRPSVASFKVPPTCEVPLGGSYHHAKDAGFRYRASDDGVKLALSVLTPSGRSEAAGSPQIELLRSTEGFKGETRATVLNGEKKPCPLVYPTEVVSCDAEGLTLRTVRSRSVDERCQPLGEAAPSWAEHRLVRDSDSGEPTAAEQ